MKHLQENTKILERYMGKVHEELKMRIKFCKQRVTERELVLMLLEYVDHESSLQQKAQDDKENRPLINLPHNLPHNLPQQNVELMAKSREVESLKEQMRVEEQLTRQFFKQLKREGMVDPAALRLSYRDIATANRSELSTPAPMQSSVNQSFATAPFEAFDAPDRVLASPQQSIQTIPSKELGRISRITSSYQQTNGADSQREKSKTFARLRKVEALFCREQKKPLSRNKSMADSWGLRSQQQCSSSGMAEQNENLKAIQNNLVTHLSIMERYKKVGSIEEVVQREQRVRRKELELMELERVLERREKQLNNSHIEVLKRQRSIKLL